MAEKVAAKESFQEMTARLLKQAEEESLLDKEASQAQILSPILEKQPAKVENCPLWFDAEKVPTRVQEQAEKCLDFLRWSQGNLKGFPGYLIHGPLGCGKTSLSIWLTMLAKGGTFTVISDLVRSIKETWGPLATEKESEILEEWRRKQLLIVDEVGGVQFGTTAERNVIYDVIVGRQNRCRPTIITTNCDLRSGTGREEFYQSAGARIADRFQGFTIDAWEWGESLRRKK